MNEYKIGNLDLIVSDEPIKYGDFFIEIKKDGNIESYMHEYINNQTNYIFNDVNVITLNDKEFKYNSTMYNYKKIINL